MARSLTVVCSCLAHEATIIATTGNRMDNLRICLSPAYTLSSAKCTNVKHSGMWES